MSQEYNDYDYGRDASDHDYRRYREEGDNYIEGSPPAPEHDSGSEWDEYEEVAGEEEGPLADFAAGIAAAPTQRVDFSFGGPADFLPSQPELFIEGVGQITLPLTDKTQAEAIIKVCEQSPFGKGFDTIVDTTVRNSYQLDPAKIKIGNPEWRKGLSKHASAIAEKLGVPGVPISLHLYKFLLYKEGGHFAKHRDTEKQDRMFATMVVQLPSQHEGGALTVYRNDGSAAPLSHDFGSQAGTAASKCHYAVHYADAEHAFTPITAGYRLALVYSICWPRKSETPAPVYGLPADIKTALVQQMTKLAADRRTFYYFLEHAYTDKSTYDLGAAALKGQDRNRLAILQAVNAACEPDAKYDFFIGKAERRTHYFGSGGGRDYANYEWDNFDGSHVSISSILSLSGVMVAGSTKSRPREKDILNPDKMSVTELWHGQRKTVYEGYFGNEGPTRDTTYHKYVLLALPRSVDLMKELGAGAVLNKLLESDASADEVESFLKKLTGTNPPVRTAGEAMRCILLDHILDQDEPVKLFDYYLRLYRGRDILGTPLVWPSAADLDDVLAIITMPALWGHDSVRTPIIDGVGPSENYVLAIIDRCMQDKVDAALWQDFMSALEKHQSNALTSKRLSDATYMKTLWDVALPNAKLRGLVLQRFQAVDGKLLKTCLEALIPHCTKDPTLVQQDGCTRPLFAKRVKWLEGEIATIGAEARREHGWSFPRAVFPQRPEVESFLRGPERELKTYGFHSQMQARYVAEGRNKLKQINCSYVAKGGGARQDAYVLYKKTVKHFGLCAAEVKVLKADLAKLQKLMGGGAVRGKGVAEGKENERPAKKTRVQ